MLDLYFMYYNFARVHPALRARDGSGDRGSRLEHRGNHSLVGRFRWRHLKRNMKNSTKKKGLLVAVLTVTASLVYFLAFR